MTVEAARGTSSGVGLPGGAREKRQPASLKITTPEGVTLFFNLADVGERATAFAIDFFIWTVATIVFYLILVDVIVGVIRPGSQVGLAVGLSIILFLGFVVRKLYFIHLDLAWQGSTPGKRAIGIRVVDRKGGPLQPMAVIARNLTREVEIFMPAGHHDVAGPQQRPGGEPGAGHLDAAVFRRCRCSTGTGCAAAT